MSGVCRKAKFTAIAAVLGALQPYPLPLGWVPNNGLEDFLDRLSCLLQYAAHPKDSQNDEVENPFGFMGTTIEHQQLVVADNPLSTGIHNWR